MEKFEDIRHSFANIRNVFTENVQDSFGASIDSEQLDNMEKDIFKLKIVEEKVNIEIINIDRMLLEARAILPRI